MASSFRRDSEARSARRDARAPSQAAGDDPRPAALHDGRVGRRRQEHADRAAAVRQQAGLRGPARPGRAGQRAPRRRGHARSRAADRRPARRARAGHHDRRRLPLLRDGQAALHHRRLPRPPAVHAQHGHRRIDGRRLGRAARRPQGRARAVQAPRLHQRPARHPQHGRGGQQDGPRRPFAASASRSWSRSSAATASCSTGVKEITYIPISALNGDNVVDRSEAMAWYEGPGAAGPSRAGRGRLRPPRREARAVPRAVGDPPSAEATARTTAATPASSPAARCERGDEVAVLPGGGRTRIAAIDTYEGELEEARRRCPSRCAWRTSSTSPAAS